MKGPLAWTIWACEEHKIVCNTLPRCPFCCPRSDVAVFFGGGQERDDFAVQPRFKSLAALTWEAPEGMLDYFWAALSRGTDLLDGAAEAEA